MTKRERKLASATRSDLMRRIGKRDTLPEKRVRSALHALGVRFRLCRADLPGKPDIVVPRRGLAIFVHGCFWHRHRNCSRTTTPRTNKAFWLEKFRANKARDAKKQRQLRALGWQVETIWECCAMDEATLARAVHSLLSAHPVRHCGLSAPRPRSGNSASSRR